MDLNPLTADFPQRLDFDEEQEAQAQSEPGPCSPKVLVGPASQFAALFCSQQQEPLTIWCLQWSSAVYPALQKGRLEIAQLVGAVSE